MVVIASDGTTSDSRVVKDIEVSAEEQTQRLEAWVDDGRNIWKLSPMHLKSYTRRDDDTKARDDMLAQTDTSWAPRFVARGKRAPRCVGWTAIWACLDPRQRALMDGRLP
jgi:polyphosphate kinase 2 (PPK2 family)